jgi:hypothetical protein
MNKLIIILSVVFLASACSFGSADTPVTMTQEETTTTTENTPNMRESTYQKDLNQASPKIKDSEEFKSCMDMNVPMCIQNAGMQLAQKNQSTEFCKELQNQDQQDACVFAITVMKLQQSNDITLCDTLSDTYKEQCTKTAIRTEALQKNDIKICSGLAKKNESADGASGSTVIMVEDGSVDECVMNVIMSAGVPNPKSCDAIKSVQMKEMCSITLRDRVEMQKTINTPQN